MSDKEELIERIAKAIWADVCDEYNGWENLSRNEQGDLEGQAMAAIVEIQNTHSIVDNSTRCSLEAIFDD